ncbi:hypothetical protein [Paenarthrobacter nicotinovorans]|uniref:hypothetical protein n=1 Tax=Paenarthrobacter nicotinovorans TaxID=29320 RepID=UPI001EE23D9A|nr:hypothetical protein [Paenarthrobacter nicotinovorans]
MASSLAVGRSTGFTSRAASNAATSDFGTSGTTKDNGGRSCVVSGTEPVRQYHPRAASE